MGSGPAAHGNYTRYVKLLLTQTYLRTVPLAGQPDSYGHFLHDYNDDSVVIVIYM
jgi:hypothetical protein